MATTVCDGMFGYETDVPYCVYDSTSRLIAGVIPISENWTPSVVFDYWPSGWSQGPAQGGLTDSSGHFSDIIQGELAGYAPPAVCTGSAAAVMHWDQQWRVGSATAGVGASVWTGTLRKYTQHAEVTVP